MFSRELKMNCTDYTFALIKLRRTRRSALNSGQMFENRVTTTRVRNNIRMSYEYLPCFRCARK